MYPHIPEGDVEGVESSDDAKVNSTVFEAYITPAELGVEDLLEVGRPPSMYVLYDVVGGVAVGADGRGPSGIPEGCSALEG